MGGHYSVTSADEEDWFDPRTVKPGQELWTAFWHHEEFLFDEPRVIHAIVEKVECVERTERTAGGQTSVSEVWDIVFEDGFDRRWRLKDGKPDPESYSVPYFWTDKEVFIADLKAAMKSTANDLLEEYEQAKNAYEHALKLAELGEFPSDHL